MKIEATARTKKGSQKFSLVDPDNFLKQLAEMKGVLKITVEEVEEDATNLQLWHFKNEVLSTFIKLSSESGNNFSVGYAEKVLKKQSGFDIDADLEDFSKPEISKLIDTSKQWIEEFFEVQVFTK